jgi:hypothetical protein
MIDTDKKAFKDMIDAVFIIYGKQAPEKEVLRVWWHKLERFEFNAVGRAFDHWTDTPNKLPQPADIVQLCKPRESEYHALPAPVATAETKANIERMNRLIKEKIKPKQNFRAWADRILNNPALFPEYAVESAKKVKNENNLPITE